MAIAVPFEFSATVSVTEYSLTNNSTVIAAQAADGVYQLFIDLSAMAAGDVYELKIYEKVQAAGTQRVVDTCRFSGVQGKPHWASPSLVLTHGWEFTLKKISGTDRAIAWSIRQVA